MKAPLALELAQGALLGSKALSVDEVKLRVAGRYPAAELLPSRPQLDSLVQELDIGFHWDGNYVFANGSKGGYCLPIAGLTSLDLKAKTHFYSGEYYTQPGELDSAGLKSINALNQEISTAVSSARFLALTAYPRQLQRIEQKLCRDYPLKPISFDELLLRHLQQQCKSMPKSPDWHVVLRADADEQNSKNWQNLQRLVQRALPAMANEIKSTGQPVLLTDPGLIARYDLVNTWLNELRQHLMNTSDDSGFECHGLIMLIAADAQSDSASIDGVTVPSGAGSSEFARIPSVWLELDEEPGMDSA
jgi:hypothetical protein